jgi:hypothetical protein
MSRHQQAGPSHPAQLPQQEALQPAKLFVSVDHDLCTTVPGASVPSENRQTVVAWMKPVKIDVLSGFLHASQKCVNQGGFPAAVRPDDLPPPPGSAQSIDQPLCINALGEKKLGSGGADTARCEWVARW